MNHDRIVLNVEMEALPGRERDLERELRAVVEPTRSEPGCLAYLLHRSPEHPHMFMFYKKFANQAALDAHVNSPHFRKFRKYREELTGPVAVTNVTKWVEID